MSPLLGLGKVTVLNNGNSNMQVEYFFDCSSPWTYLSYTRIEDICSEAGADLIWRPFLVGGVFNTVNPSVYENREKPVLLKARYYAKDLRDWADYQGVVIGSPPVFPVNSVKVMRGCFVAIEQGCISEYAGRVFNAYWTELKDISQDEVIREIVQATNLDTEDFFARITSADYKAMLRDNTEELVTRGGFGSPTMFIDGDDIYFGNDRMELVRHRLGLKGS